MRPCFDFFPQQFVSPFQGFGSMNALLPGAALRPLSGLRSAPGCLVSAFQAGLVFAFLGSFGLAFRP
jgi:hypothetical protein